MSANPTDHPDRRPAVRPDPAPGRTVNGTAAGTGRGLYIAGRAFIETYTAGPLYSQPRGPLRV